MTASSFISSAVLPNSPEEVGEEAVFITVREAAGWFADDPESVPEWMRPLVEKFDLTEGAAGGLEPAATPSPSENGRLAPRGTGPPRRTAATPRPGPSCPAEPHKPRERSWRDTANPSPPSRENPPEADDALD